eukprot:Protomagalhaensia_sp_Gyna_25__2198@NODE_2197_length_1228_cov_186_121951_g1818_i0_p1_GENE_NODE_2197_length_1228_cov_186_121951_g1818_i0NODE_2197_length_1228_cov_186_121951_g1818_i0_p1_ORF_typecomplete_len213_score25_55_NODE_2197_length_1228_cov_186_121951_g1818_i04231061
MSFFRRLCRVFGTPQHSAYMQCSECGDSASSISAESHHTLTHEMPSFGTKVPPMPAQPRPRREREGSPAVSPGVAAESTTASVSSMSSAEVVVLPPSAGRRLPRPTIKVPRPTTFGFAPCFGSVSVEPEPSDLQAFRELASRHFTGAVEVLEFGSRGFHSRDEISEAPQPLPGWKGPFKLQPRITRRVGRHPSRRSSMGQPSRRTVISGTWC